MEISTNGYWLNEIMLSLKPEMRRRLAKQKVNQKQDVGNVPMSFRADEYTRGALNSMALLIWIKIKRMVIIMNKVLLKKLNTEYDELTDKIAKAWPAASNLDIPDEQRQLIGIQARAMETYEQVLAIRIRLLEK